MNYSVKEDTDTHYIIEIEVPGIPPDELKATLSLNGDSRVNIEHIDTWGDFITLPDHYSYSRADAYVEHGMLTVVVHKQQTEHPINIVDRVSSNVSTSNDECNEIFVPGESIIDENKYVKPGDCIQFQSGDWELVKDDKRGVAHIGYHVSHYQDVRRPCE